MARGHFTTNVAPLGPMGWWESVPSPLPPPWLPTLDLEHLVSSSFIVPVMETPPRDQVFRRPPKTYHVSRLSDVTFAFLPLFSPAPGHLSTCPIPALYGQHEHEGGGGLIPFPTHPEGQGVQHWL